MSELFGAPSGIEALDRTTRENFFGGVKALEEMGRIAQQPADLALKQSHARYYSALADEHAAKVEQERQMAELGRETAAARDQGVDLNVEDAEKIRARPKSLADPLVQMYELGVRKGMSPTKLAPIATQAATLLQKEAAAASSQARQERLEIQSNLDRARRAGELASMGLRGPEAYDRMLMQAANEGMDIGSLPKSWGGPAVAALQNLREQSVPVVDKLKLDLDASHKKAQEARWRAQNAVSQATVELRRVQVKDKKERLDRFVKNDGDGGPISQELKRERIAASKSLREARDAAKFPPIPLEQSAVDPASTYTTRSGLRVRPVLDPNGDITGLGGQKMRLVQVGVAPRGQAAEPVPDTEDDDDEDD